MWMCNQLWITVSLKLMEWVLVVWSMAGSGPEQSEVVPLILHSDGVQDATRCGSCRIRRCKSIRS